jgi:hypothetical protein
MASFTDQISQFNPYVQQLPVDAMTQVGMYKQQQYDQGVQKIQSYMDNIAGMDVYKNEHKQYLQSKLNELGGKLRTVAAGDFSNQQLVNSVGGMATQIVKDPIVQTAIYSTQVVRKGDADRELAAKEGKSSPSNDDYWNEQKATWLNDKSLTSPFSGKYIEHWDVDKKLLDKAKLIMEHPDEYVADNPWKRDDKGNTLYFGTEMVKDAKGAVVKDKAGKPVTRQIVSIDPSKGERQIDDAMLKMSTKGTSAEKLYNNFLDSLDSKDAQQLRIDARYKYKGIKPEAFTKDVINIYKNKKDFLSQEIVNLSVALTNSDLTAVQQGALKARLTDLQEQEKSGQLDKDLNSTLEALQDPATLEKYKADMYTQKHLMNMATDLAYKSYKQELSSNPYTQMFMEKQKFNLANREFADASARGWANIDLAKQRLLWDKESFFINYKKEEEEKKKPGTVVVPGQLPTGGDPPTLESQTQVLVDKANQITALDNTFADRLFPNLNVKQKQAAFAKLIKEYETNPRKNYSPDEIKYLEQHRAAVDEYTAQANLVTTAQQKTEEFKNKELATKVKGVGNYSGFDIADATIEMDKFKTNIVGPGAGYGYRTDAAIAFFKNYKGGRYLPLLEANLGKFKFSQTPEQKKLVSAIDEARKVTTDIAPKVQKFTSDYLAKYNPKSLVQFEGLNPADAATGDAITKFLTIAAKNELTAGGKIAQTALGWMTGEDGAKTRFGLEKSKDGTTQMVVIDPTGKSHVSIPMGADSRPLFPQILETSSFNSYKDLISTSPNFTTNTIGARSPQVDNSYAVTAKITGFDLPNLKSSKIAQFVRVDVEGDKDNSGQLKTDGYSVIMYAFDPSKNIWKAKRIGNRYIQEGGVVNVLSAISEDTYNEAIKTWK